MPQEKRTVTGIDEWIDGQQLTEQQKNIVEKLKRSGAPRLMYVNHRSMGKTTAIVHWLQLEVAALNQEVTEKNRRIAELEQALKMLQK